MRPLNRKLKVAMEDANVNEISSGVIDVVELEPVAESVETELLDIQDAQTEIAVDEALVEQSTEAVVALESFYEAMRGLSKEGGMSRPTANFVSLATAHVLSTLGYTAQEAKSSVAMESYQSFGGRQGATIVAMEELGTKIKEIWAMIIDKLSKIRAAITKAFMEIFSAAEKLGAKANKLAERAAAYKGEVKPKLEGLGTKIGMPGSNSAIPKGVSNILETCKDVFGEFTSHVGQGGDALAKAFEDAGNSTGNDGAAGAAAGIVTITKPFKTQQQVSNAADYEAPEGLQVYRGLALPGNQAVLTFTGGTDPKSAARAGSKLGAFDPKAQLQADVPGLNGSAAAEVAKNVAAIAEEVIKHRQNVAAADKLKDRLINAAKKIASRADGLVAKVTEKVNEKTGDAPAQAGEQFRYLQQLATSAANKIDQPYAALASYSLRTGKTLLDMVELSITEGKGAAAPAEPAPAAA